MSDVATFGARIARRGNRKINCCRDAGSNRALRFSAMRVGRSVGHAMMQGEPTGVIPSLSRFGCDGAAARTLEIGAVDAGQRDHSKERLPSTPRKGCRRATIVA